MELKDKRTMNKNYITLTFAMLLALLLGCTTEEKTTGIKKADDNSWRGMTIITPVSKWLDGSCGA